MSYIVPRDKPKRCTQPRCRFMDRDTLDCRLQDKSWESFEEQYEHCPLIEVPPHGELVDKEDDRIEVGDIVDRYIDGKLDSKGIYLQEEGGYWRCLFNTGAVLMTFAYPKGQFKKTGKHYDIQSILEAMRT